MKNILITSDLSENSLVALAVGKELAKKLAATVTLVSVFQDPSSSAVIVGEVAVMPDPEIINHLRVQSETELTQIAVKYFPEQKIKTALISSTGDASQDIVDYAKANNHDLIIISTRGRTGIARMLIGSVAEKVVRFSSCPVLTVRASPQVQV